MARMNFRMIADTTKHLGNDSVERALSFPQVRCPIRDHPAVHPRES